MASPLQHGQQIIDAPKMLLTNAGFAVGEPAESHLCCGSAGTYNMLQPEIAGRLRERKVANLEALGADLIAPLSLVLDDLGIYYDPSRESRLERLINATDDITQAQRTRAERLIRQLIDLGLSKYNLAKAPPPEDLPQGRRILIPGQVEDDASIRLGASDVRTNRALIEATGAAKRPGRRSGEGFGRDRIILLFSTSTSAPSDFKERIHIWQRISDNNQHGIP